MNPTSFVTVSGRSIDLAAPALLSIDFDDIAEQLAKVARFNGATPGTVYSVAEHLVLGTDWLLLPDEERALLSDKNRFEAREDPRRGATEQRRLAAAYYLCHDFEEAYLGDDTTPKKRAIDQKLQKFGTASGLIQKAYAELAEDFNVVLHAAAGLPWPMPDEIASVVHSTDLRMLVTEWTTLRPKHPLPEHYAAHEPLPIAINPPWQWPFAEHQLKTRMEMLLPALRRNL